jgi:glycosyltransferase involved in cell wall biosynthesis
MKIMMVLDLEFPPDMRVQKEAESLIDKGHEVHLICYRFSFKRKKEEIINGIFVHRRYIPLQMAKKSVALMLHFPFYVLFWQLFIKKMIRRINPDTIHVHDLPLSLPASKIVEKQKKHFILDLHENYPDSLRQSKHMQTFLGHLIFSFERWLKLEKKLIDKADYVITVSEEHKKELQIQHKSKTPIVVVPNTIKLSMVDNISPGEWTASFFDNSKINLLYVGNINPTRGFETVLRGISIMGEIKDKLNFVIVGSGPSLHNLKKLVDELKLNSIIKFVGRVPYSRVAEFCQLADICLSPLRRLPQTEITYPNKLYEYAFFCKPILAGATIGQENRIKELECGKTYISDSPESFANTLMEMISNPEELKKYGAQGRKNVLEKYNWDITAQSLINLYTSLDTFVATC